jgi:uncharacterized protein DUF4397
MTVKRWVLVTLAAAGMACGSYSSPSQGGNGMFEAINASANPVDVYLGGYKIVSGLASGLKSGIISVRTGNGTIEVRPAGSGAVGRRAQVTVTSTAPASLVVIDSNSVLNPVVLTDTGTITPAGASKLRVVHYATSAPAIDVYRTQPDFPTLITVMFPFAYKSASPFLQSTPGGWTIVVSHEGLTDTLLATGNIPVADGKARTVVLLDAPGGGIGFVVLDEN